MLLHYIFWSIEVPVFKALAIRTSQRINLYLKMSLFSHEPYNYSGCVLMVELIYVRFRERCYLWDFNSVMNITDGGSSRKPSNFLSLTVKHVGFEPKTGAVTSGQDRVFLSINCLSPHRPLCAIWYLICYLFSLWLDMWDFCALKSCVTVFLQTH